jgi:hypothetical protein
MPNALIRNWHLKLAALGLSVFLWALVQTEPLSQETFSSVPVLVEVADTAWTITGEPTPAMVELRLGGPAREIIRLAREGLSVLVPIPSVGSRDTTIALQRDWVQLGQRPGVTVESISPATLRVSFERAVTRSIPVAMRVQGNLPADLALSSALGVDPEAVLVRGSEGRLAGLDSLPLAPLDLGRIRDSNIVELAVDTSGLGGAAVVPPTVMVGVRVEPMIVRELGSVEVHADVRGADAQVTVEPATIRLRLSGARTLVTTMDLSLLRVSVPPASLAGLLVGEARLVPVQVDGVPPLVTALPGTEVVTVRRVVGTREPTRQDPS